MIANNVHLTYLELRTLSNKVCRVLESKGIKKETPVILLCSYSPYTIIAMLGILKSGAICVPIDPNLVTEKIRKVIERAAIVLCEKSIHNQFNFAQPIAIEDCLVLEENPIGKSKLHPDQAAFIIYTSGSTGIANGVVITHQNITSKAQTISASLDITKNDRCILTASLSFIASLRQIFVSLINEIALVIVEADTLRDPKLLFRKILENKVTIIDFVPSYCKTCAQILLNSSEKLELSSVRQIATSGEKLSLDVVIAWRKLIPHVRFLNIYGQTETTAGITVYEVSKNTNNTPSNVPVGFAVGCNRIYILDAHLQPVPVGVTGSIYVESNEVTRCYYKDAMKTALKFIPNPFTGGVLYQTGDYGRYNRQNQLEIISRNDALVKVRGYRVDTIEVEVALRQHSDVCDAAVIFCSNVLKAYIVTTKNLSYKNIREHLQKLLSEYMIPQKIFSISILPKTNSGKVDYRSLIKLDQQQRFLFTRVWNKCRILEPRHGEETYLLFTDRIIECQGADVILVTHSQKFNIDRKNITIDFNCKNHYVLLIDYLRSIDFNFKKVIYDHKKMEFFTTFVKTFELYLTQMHIAIICRNVFPVNDQCKLVAENALIVGAARVLPLEYPGLRYACIEMQDDYIFDNIVQELRHCLPDTDVAYVDGQRHGVRYQEIDSRPIEVCDGQVYLITGGLGNIGLRIALSLAQIAKVKIAITTRYKKNLSPKVQEILDEIKNLGSEVALFENSLKNENQIADLIFEVRNNLGDIFGVMHCAGARELFRKLSVGSALDKESRFKIESTQILTRVLAKQNAQFLLVFSSLASLFGRYGQGNYSAVNAYLDILAQVNAAIKVISINWDVWRELPLPVAKGLSQDITDLIYQDAKNGISNCQGIEALLKIPNFSYRQIIVSTRPEITGYYINELITNNEFISASTPLEKQITDIWRAALKQEKISVDDHFFYIGGHSLIAVTVMEKIRYLIGIRHDDYKSLPLSLLLTHPTIRQLAKVIEEAAHSPDQDIIQMNSKVANKPIVFLVHAAHVDPISYQHLCKCLDGKTTIYTFQTRDLDLYATIEETALHNIKKIKSVQPEGPYFIGGMCMGGLVTYEVARQLHEQGNNVALAFIMDAINIPGMKKYKSSQKHKTKRWWRKIKNLYKIIEFAGHLLIVDIDFVRKKVKKIKSNIERKTKKISDPQEKLRKKMRHRLRVIRDQYQPLHYSGEIIYIRSEKEAGRFAEDRFRELAGSVKCHQVKGTIHRDVTRQKFAEATSEIVCCYLE